MAQMTTPLSPRQNHGKDTDKKHVPWAVILFFLLVIGGPVGVLLCIIAAVVFVVLKLKQNGGAVSKGGVSDFVQKHGTTGRRPKHTAQKQPAAYPGRRIDQPPVQQHVHGSLTDHCRAKRLEQLETLKEAGLYSEEEYKAKKRQIIRETANQR